MPWTKEQEAVITSRGGDLLVSAAAGSGKTAVLVERILTMICDEKVPVDIDRMLIVTFTKAAAAEMKERIGHAIENYLQKNPENEHVRRQSAYLQKAQISTIHSFCLQLIRDHFNTLGIDPEFRMMDEGEGKLLRIDVMKEVLEQFYEEGSDKFHLLVEGYTNGKDDKALEELVQRLYEFAMSNPEPEEWLNRAKKRFFIENKEALYKSSYMQELIASTKQLLEELLEKNQLALELARKPFGPIAYEKTLLLDQDYILSCSSQENYEDMKKAMELGAFSRLSGRPAKDTDESLKEMVKQLRDEVKEQLVAWKEQFFAKTGEEMLQEVILVKEPMEALMDVVFAFKEQFSKAKEKKNVLDFSDLEHYALELLVDRYEDDSAIPSNIAKEIGESYEEIFIDEYQDSNFIQEAILGSISGGYKGEQNRFMVGDVKQSIYRFRLARPELFMDKFDKYGKDNEKEKKIELHRNFRSRFSVLESTNYIFQQIMGRDLGGVEYDESAFLIPGRAFPKREQQGEEMEVAPLEEIDPLDKTELIIVEAEESDYTKKELEAYAIANRIRELMKEENPYCVYDEKIGAYRPVEYRDIVILLRTVSGWGDVLEEVLAREGIPAHGDSQTGYFSALEVQNMLHLLAVVDNRYQDISMTAVLRSPIVGLHGEELAWMKAVYSNPKNGRQTLYDVLSLFAEEEFDEEQQTLLLGKNVTWCKGLQVKVQQFLQLLEEMEYGKTCMSIHDLIWFAMNRTGYFYYVGSMPQGKKRQGNLLMLIEKANQYESVSYKGLFHFIRYMNQLKEYEVDFGEASVLGEHENVVRIMSIHKSKGLEFPVVIVGELNKPFNFMDLRQKLLIHVDDYLGPDCVELETRRIGSTWMKNLMQKKLKEETLGEELRVLYVAMTRAKEKLILIGTVDDYDKKQRQNSYIRYQWEKKAGQQFRLARSIRTRATCYLDWLLAALVVPQTLIDIRFIEEQQLVVQRVEQEVLLEHKKEALLQLQPEEENKEIADFIRKQFEWTYPFEQEVEFKGKYSVSELKKQGQLEEGELYFEESDFEHLSETMEVASAIEEEERIRPEFMEEEKVETGASHGTLVHKVMELLTFKTITTTEDVRKQLIQFEQEGYFTKEQRESLPVYGILSLLQSPIGKRLQQAEKEGRLHKESQYMMALPAKEIKDDMESEELVLLQGVIDVWWEEENEIVILDYKTDRISSENELQMKYHVQMKYYKKALEQMTGKRVKETYFYSFALKQFVKGEI